MAHILVVDDEEGMREFLKVLLEREGHQVTAASDGAEALRLAREEPVDLVISDLRMPKLDGVGLLSGLRELDPYLPVIVITAYASVESAVSAMKLGAYDYIIKPFKVDELKLVVAKALEAERLRRENLALKQELRERHRFPGLIGQSPKMLALYELMEKVAPLSTTILITGESGTGKELVARAIHYASPRAERPFLAINCSAIPEALLESELFGHVKGAFTGAVAHKAGLFEVADGGTIFLDEIGEMSPALQVRLLRVLQEKAFRRVGGTEDIKVDVRLIAATNRDLKEAIAKGTFREDLYWRLNVIPIHLPPLRERKGDIPLLASEFLRRFAKEQGREGLSLSPEAMALLEGYDWPGNVRELENVIERAVALERGDRITPDSLPDHIRNTPPPLPSPFKGEGWEGVAPVSGLQSPVSSFESKPQGIDLEEALSEVEKTLMLDALEKAGWVQTRAAKILGINFRSFRYRVRKYGLDVKKRPET